MSYFKAFCTFSNVAPLASLPPSLPHKQIEREASQERKRLKVIIKLSLIHSIVEIVLAK